jgi:2-hydroxy-3-keto-5-methylthiopentenyl-1-phosphate phosphatase
MPLTLFVDFDGTIATNDIGNVLFRTFGGPACDRYVREYRNGAISARDCFRREVEALGRVDAGRLEEFIESQPIDPGFGRFVEFCRGRGVEFHIVSDGLDFYIDRFFRHHGFGGLSRFANTLRIDPETGFGVIEFPHSAEECDRCACCKRNILLGLCGEQDTIGYIGDGLSDQCPAQYADIVFAKKELQTFCQKENISYFPYADFLDIVRRLEELLSRNILRKRRRAELKRQEAFRREA